MGNLERRIKALAPDGSGEPCPECGWDEGWSEIRIEVVWVDIDDEEIEDEPHFCSECGRQLIYEVSWLDLPAGERGAAGWG